MRSVIFIAPPAAGKGTQSKLLKEEYGYIHISTGDLLREEINNNTEIGIKAKDIMNAGGLVDDETIISLVKVKLENLNGKPFILDGFPRTLNQAKELDKMFNELNIDDYKVVYLTVPVELALQRALGRITCTKCGTSYNIYSEKLKPMVDGICDKCQTALVKRTDDNEESFKNRFETFTVSSKPIVEFYEEKNKLVYIDSIESDKCHETMKETLND